MVGSWPHRPFTFRALAKTDGQMWTVAMSAGRYARLKLRGCMTGYRTNLTAPHELRPEVHPLTSRLYSENWPTTSGNRPDSRFGDGSGVPR